MECAPRRKRLKCAETLHSRLAAFINVCATVQTVVGALHGIDEASRSVCSAETWRRWYARAEVYKLADKGPYGALIP